MVKYKSEPDVCQEDEEAVVNIWKIEENWKMSDASLLKNGGRTQNYTRAQCRRDLPKRKRQDNKTRGGKCLVVAGSRGLWGAGILSATAASRCGAGYVYLLLEGKMAPEITNIHYTTGNYSMFVKIHCRDTNHLKEVLHDKMQQVEGIDRTETMISLEESLDRSVILANN
jgi:DNA-binding Lrp family transcriptional regulator